MGSHESNTDWGETPADGAETSRQAPDDAMGLLEFALRYPGRNGLKHVIVGAVVFMFFWLLIPLLIAAGYYVRLTKAAAQGDREPPEFTDWGGLLVDGVGLVLVLLPVIVVSAILMFVAMEISVVLYLVVALALSYVLPALYLNYAVNDSWSATYNVSAIQTLITDRTYAIGFLLYLLVINGIGAIVAAVLMGLSLLTIVGWIIIWPMIYFYWLSIDASLWGRVYNRIESAEPNGQ